MKSKRLAETLRQGRRNDVSTANQVLTYLSDAISHRQDLLVKILRKNRGEPYFKTYNVYAENGDICDPRNNHMTIFGRSDYLEETAAQTLRDDLARAVQHDASWGASPFMVKVDDDAPCACDIIWEDATNVLYFICDISRFNGDWNDIIEMIDNLQSYVHELTNANNLNTNSIIAAISHVTEEDVQDHPRIKQFLLQFVPEQQQQAVRNRFHIDIAANNGQAQQPEQPRPNQDAQDDENNQNDELDINLDDEVAQDADDDQENEEPQQQQQQQQQQQEQPAIRYLGEWSAAEHGRPNADFTVIFGPYDEQRFQNVLSQYPQTAVNALVGGKPYRYKQLAGSDYNGIRVFGNAQGAKKAFTDVCRNYKLFAFPETTDIRWTQRHLGHECFFQWANGNTPDDMWGMMSGAGNGNEFIGFFYGRCRSEYRRAAANNGNINIHPIWDASNSAVKMQTVQARSKQPNGAGTAQNTQTQPNQSGPMTDEQKRQYIVATIERRLIDELAQPPAGHGTPNDYVIVPIRKQSDNTILVGSVGHRNGSSYYRKTFFNAKSCRTLAQSYDDWQWAGRGRNAAARAFYQKLQRLLDPATAEPPPEKEVINLSPEEQKKLDTAMAAANERLNGTGIEVQITVPGHKPQYNYIQSLGSRQGSGWPKDQHRYFTVMFTGLELQKYFGNQAEAYLRGLGLYRYVEAALAEAKKTYNDIILAVALDNGIPSKS